MAGRALGPLPVLPQIAWLHFQLASDLEGSGQEDGPAVEGPVLFPEPRGERASWLFFLSGREAALRWQACGIPSWPRPMCPGPSFGLPTSPQSVSQNSILFPGTWGKAGGCPILLLVNTWQPPLDF